MFVADRLIYLQMQKTACSHITKILSTVMPGEVREPHSRLTFDPGDRIVVGSVRNPWDWYVSLWAYGCAGKGALHNAVTVPRKSARRLARAVIPALPNMARAYRGIRQWLAIDDSCHRRWRLLYGDPEDIPLFRRWLVWCLGEEGKKDLIEGYPQSKLRHCAGFMTYRFVTIYSDVHAWETDGKDLNDVRGLDAFFAKSSVLDTTIRMEYLQHDLLKILRELGYDPDPAIVSNGHRTNTSRHRFYKEYYDAATEALVADQERFIIERYGYRPPSAG